MIERRGKTTESLEIWRIKSLEWDYLTLKYGEIGSIVKNATISNGEQIRESPCSLPRHAAAV